MLKYRYCAVLCCIIMAMASVGSLLAQSGKIVAKDPNASAAITAAKKALGGDKNIDGVKSLILAGTSKVRQPNGSYVTQKIEIRVLLPDNLLWINQSSFGGNELVAYSGVSRGELRNASFFGTQQTASAKIDPKDQNAVNAQLDRFTYLLMGALLKADPVAPLTISPVPGASNRFSVEKTNGALGEIEFDQKEKYPSLVRYKDIVQKPMQMTSDPKTGQMNFSLSTGTEVVDAIMRFKDRVATNGIMFPKTIVYESQGNVARELQFEKILINPNITIEDFKLPQ